MILRRILVALTLTLSGPAPAAQEIALRAGGWTIRANPGTLRVEAVSDTGTSVLISEGQPGLGSARIVEQDYASAHWTLDARGLTVRIRIEGNDISIGVQSDRVGELVWPVVVPGKGVEALILPRGEGNWVPVDDPAWGRDLAGEPDNSVAVTEEFSVPFWGLALRGGTFTCILPNPFNSELGYVRRGGRLGFRITHTFTRLDREKVYGCIVRIGGPSPVEPARQYRAWLIQQGGFVTMADKIRDVPRAGRLPGALHAYLWGEGPLRLQDVQDWKGFCRDLKGAGETGLESPAGRIWKLMSAGARKQVDELVKAEWEYDYPKQEIARELNRLIGSSLRPSDLVAAFPRRFTDPEGWGDGISVKFLKMLNAAGIDRACLILNDLNAGDGKPEIARAAEELGFLYGPYDSYNSIHMPGEADPWATAQFDSELYEQGAVMRANGTFAPGFARRGRHLSSLAARPWVEKRVGGKMAAIPFSAWFVDCDAYGQWFDNYSSRFAHTQAADLAARIVRMRWIARTYGVPVGSEGGSALAAGGIHFAHGMTTPAIGWGDPDFKDEKSKYFLGGWWPPERPKVFFLPAELKDRYRRSWFDPRYRLPLYEIVMHDAVIATHHWSSAAFKFKRTWAAMALLDQLYNAPPLYHFTVDDFTRQKDRILAHYAFFSPLHRRLAIKAMTDFRWLTEDRLVQKTVFSDGTEIVANFGTATAEVDGAPVPAGSVVSRWNGETASYAPSDW